MARHSIRTDFFQAGKERLDDSRLLLDEGAYAGSIYYAGVAAESVIKGFITSKSEEIKGHNLKTLAVDANFARRLKIGVRDRVNAAISEAAPLWRNLYRYSSEVDMQRMALEFKLRFEVDGRMVRYADLENDAMKLWAERLYNLASLIVNEGILLWQSKQR